MNSAAGPGQLYALPIRSSLTHPPYLQSAMPACNELFAHFKSTHDSGKEKFTRFLRDRVFSKNTSPHACVPLSKCLTFANGACTEKPREDLKERTAEMEQEGVEEVGNDDMQRRRGDSSELNIARQNARIQTVSYSTFSVCMCVYNN